jgi:hypothetical protein
MKTFALVICLLATTTAFAANKQKAAQDKLISQNDARECTIDAMNYQSIALMASVIKTDDIWKKYSEMLLATTHSSEEKAWVAAALDLAWSGKGYSSPVKQAMDMYDSCVKMIEKDVT